MLTACRDWQRLQPSTKILKKQYHHVISKCEIYTESFQSVTATLHS